MDKERISFQNLCKNLFFSRRSVTQRLRRGNQVVRSLSYLCVGLPPRDADRFLLCVLLSPTPKAFQHVFFAFPQNRGNSKLDYLLTLWFILSLPSFLN
jgi:hypothetical protein